MKVHVTVDDSIYPELHALMEQTPLGKRARVLANLAYKALLLGNAKLLLGDHAPAASPRKPRDPSEKRSKDSGKNSSRPGLHGQIDNGIKEEPNVSVSDNILAASEKTGSKADSEESSQSVQATELNSVVENTNAVTDSAGALVEVAKQMSASDQQILAEGEQSGENLGIVVGQRKRRILR